MTRTVLRWIGVLVAGAASAAAAQEPLLPAEVARSARQHYPEVAAALAERDGAQGTLLSARGGFDTVLSVEGRGRVTGFYTGDVVEAKAERAFGRYGAKGYAAYRLSDGTFPIYEDAAFTNQSGEFKLGLIFSLLRDRDIDERRFAVADAGLAAEQADLDLLLTQVGVQRRALLAYYEWVEAGQELAVYEDVLALARTRQGALEQQVARGARAAIFLTENAQNLTRREMLTERARRDLARAANALSLYYRDADGRPLSPPRDRLPETVPIPTPIAADDLPAVLLRRPDLALLRIGAERARGRLELARNALAPRLDIGVEAGQDLGPLGEGGFTRDQGEVILGATFAVPLGNRGARGKRAKAEAELRAIEHRRRLAVDRIEVELRDVLLSLEAAERLVRLAGREAEQAETMRLAEISRFENGASDFFLLNLREEAVADARIRYALSILDLNAARTTYDAAILDLERLGL